MNASLIDHEGRPAVMAIIRDMTERKRAEEAFKKYANELSRVNEELKSLSKMKDEFLSNVGHELKTPLVSIKGFSEMVYDEKLGDVNKQQHVALDKVLKNTERLNRLVDSLLYVSMVQTGNVKYSFEDVKIDEVLDHTINHFSDKLRDKDLVLEKKVPENLPVVNGDRDKLIDMLKNIFDNAVKFTPSGGKISLNASINDKHLHIGVKDNGIGIPKSMMSNLFQSFYQIDASTTRMFGGTGLGLYMCKNIIDAHEGDIWLESEEGVGTVVNLKLPKRS
jgi:signal transduction histidine kinase